jgi:hypothetical protein
MLNENRFLGTIYTQHCQHTDYRSRTFSDVIYYATEEEEFVPLYEKLSLPSGVMTTKTLTMNVICGYGLDLFASQDPLQV